MFSAISICNSFVKNQNRTILFKMCPKHEKLPSQGEQSLQRGIYSRGTFTGGFKVIVSSWLMNGAGYLINSIITACVNTGN